MRRIIAVGAKGNSLKTWKLTDAILAYSERTKKDVKMKVYP
jgi:hypothetical protein